MFLSILIMSDKNRMLKQHKKGSHPLQLWRTNSTEEFMVVGPICVHSDTEGTGYLQSPLAMHSVKGGSTENRRSSGSCWSHWYQQHSLSFRFIHSMESSKRSHHAVLQICVQSQKPSPRVCVGSTYKAERKLIETKAVEKYHMHHRIWNPPLFWLLNGRCCD